MKHLTLTAAKDDFDGLIESVIELGEPVSVATDKGAAIIISQDEWNGLAETVYLESIPGMLQSIKTALETPVNERLEDIGWDIN